MSQVTLALSSSDTNPLFPLDEFNFTRKYNARVEGSGILPLKFQRKACEIRRGDSENIIWTYRNELMCAVYIPGSWRLWKHETSAKESCKLLVGSDQERGCVCHSQQEHMNAAN